MIEAIGIAAALVALAVAVFVASVRIGILVGLRVDRSLEAQASTGGADDEAGVPIAGGNRGREEIRGE